MRATTIGEIMYSKLENQLRVGILGGLGLLFLAFAALLTTPQDSSALPSWSRKYKADCNMCHTQLYPRLNTYGERFQKNGCQNPDDTTPDGDTEGKENFSKLLNLDKNAGHWFSARLNLTPIQIETNAQTIEKEPDSKITLGNSNWVQLFVAGSLMKNVSIYIENEFAADGYHQAWYYLGMHNILNTSWTNLQMGRLSPVVFAPYPDRLPQLPLIGKGILRVKTSKGNGEMSTDMRSPRNGIQYYGYQGPVSLYAGVTPGANPSNAGNGLGYWVGASLQAPDDKLGKFGGSAIGIHFDGGTDTKNSQNIASDSLSPRENAYTRIMLSSVIRWNDKLDLQLAYVMATEDNPELATDAAAKELAYNGFRVTSDYSINERWLIGLHYDKYSSDDDLRMAEQHMLYFPTLTYLYRQNFRVTFYPGLDLVEEEGAYKKRNLFAVNIRTSI